MPVNFFRYRFVLTGGGTGGHIMPLLAVAESLREYNVDLLYLGSHGGREEALASQAKIPFKGIFSGKWRRYYTVAAILDNIIDLLKLVIGFFEALVILLQFRPHAIMAKGGSVSLPVVVAGWVLNIPILIHESDVEMGLTNKISVNVAREIATGFPTDNYHIEGKNLVYTGIPVESGFYDSKIKDEDYRFFHFNKKLPVLLITGGIQGAHKINMAVLEVLPKMLEDWQVIHLAGENDYPQLKDEKDKLESHKDRYAVFPILGKERVAAMRIAEIIISRASATTLAEVAMMAKPAILIPLKGSANDHQVKNASMFDQAGAAEVIKEDRLTGVELYETIESLKKATEKRHKMAEAMGKLAKPEAGRIIVEELLKLVRE